MKGQNEAMLGTLFHEGPETGSWRSVPFVLMGFLFAWGSIGLTEQVGGVICVGVHADSIVGGSAVH